MAGKHPPVDLVCLPFRLTDLIGAHLVCVHVFDDLSSYQTWSTVYDFFQKADMTLIPLLATGTSKLWGSLRPGEEQQQEGQQPHDTIIVLCPRRCRLSKH